MRQAQQRIRRNQVAKTLSVSSPVNGWNARDPISEMKPADALILDNFFCTPYDVMVRNGYSSWVPSITNGVNTLVTYSGQSGTNKMFAASLTNIYDVSAAGALGGAVVTGMTSDKWQYCNFGAGGGTYLVMANGTDPVQEYNGSTWSVPAITGVTSATLLNPLGFKGRLYFVQKSSMSIWYLPPLSIAGAAVQIDLSTIFTQGGYVMSICDWSLDAGYGMDDYLAVISSNGEVAVYRGTDPSSATTWALVGVYSIGSPIGSRCASKYAGDVLIICQDGLAPLSKALMSSRVNSQEMLSDRIQHVISDYITQYGSIFGWQVQLFPKENMLILNVPNSSNGSYQLVMNTISGAWSRWLDINATCFAMMGDYVYFGTHNGVYKMWDTQSDNGNLIQFEAQQSFNYFGSMDQLKKLEMIRPNITTSGKPAILLGANADYDTSKPVGIATFTPGATGAIWGTAIWGTSVWGGTLGIKRDWQTAFSMGYCFAAHMTGALSGITVRWSSTDFLVKPAGVL